MGCLFAVGQAVGGPMTGLVGDWNAILPCAVISPSGCAVILMVPVVGRLHRTRNRLDTEYESLGEFQNGPAIVEAFRDNDSATSRPSSTAFSKEN